MLRLEHDDRYMLLRGPSSLPTVYLNGVSLTLEQMKGLEVYVRKEDVIAAALQLALEDLPELVRQLHSLED